MKHQLRLHRAPSNLALNTSKEGVPQFLFSFLPLNRTNLCFQTVSSMAFQKEGTAGVRCHVKQVRLLIPAQGAECWCGRRTPTISPIHAQVKKLVHRGKRGTELWQQYAANRMCSCANTDKHILMREAPLDLVGIIWDALVQDLPCKQVTYALMLPRSALKYKIKH